jgi:hypothetical protein
MSGPMRPRPSAQRPAADVRIARRRGGRARGGRLCASCALHRPKPWSALSQSTRRASLLMERSSRATAPAVGIFASSREEAPARRTAVSTSPAPICTSHARRRSTSATSTDPVTLGARTARLGTGGSSRRPVDERDPSFCGPRSSCRHVASGTQATLLGRRSKPPDRNLTTPCWNARYVTASIDHLHATKPDVVADETAVARVAPVTHAHVNSLGRYDLHRESPHAGHLRERDQRPATEELPPACVITLARRSGRRGAERRAAPERAYNACWPGIGLAWSAGYVPRMRPCGERKARCRAGRAEGACPGMGIPGRFWRCRGSCSPSRRGAADDLQLDDRRVGGDTDPAEAPCERSDRRCDVEKRNGSGVIGVP